MRRLRLPHSVKKRYRRFPRVALAGFYPTGKPETDNAVQRGLGRNAEGWRKTDARLALSAAVAVSTRGNAKTEGPVGPMTTTGPMRLTIQTTTGR